uniref:Condensin-2 complex subunit H2 n=1 Tax=Ciona intestinalis TaxID=7719 RepID=F6ZEU6_CIOIN
MGDLNHQRFEFLLHPIKDLTKNWNINIANVLEDYLTELEKMTFSFDGGKTTLNFAEASLMIQGTACVWGRKVEYLHSLVYQTLELIRNNKKNTHHDTNEDQTNQTRVCGETEDQFLNMDNLNETPKEAPHPDDVPLLIVGLCFLGGPDVDNRGTPFKNTQGEVFNYYNDFWANQSTPNLTEGRALLEQPNKLSNNVVQLQTIHALEAHNVDVTMGDLPDVSCHSGNDDVINDNDDVINDVTIQPEQPVNDVIEEIVSRYLLINNHYLYFEIFSYFYVQVEVRQLRQRFKPTTPVDTPIVNPPPSQPMLDPHTPCPESLWQPKPFKKGNCSRLPSGVSTGKKRKKAGCHDNDASMLGEFMEDMKTEEIEKKRRMLCWRGLREKQIQNKRKHSKILNKIKIPVSLVDEVFATSFHDDHNDDDGCHGNNDVTDDVINDALGIDGLMLDVEENRGGDPEIERLQSFVGTLENYEDLVRHHVEKFYASAKSYRNESALSQRVVEWEKSIAPSLSEEDKHPEFDIHTEGDEMVKQFNIVGQTKYFCDVIKREPVWSICRRFSATLQLANDLNFLLQSEGDPIMMSSVNTLSLKLLTQQKSRQRLDGY